MQALTNATMATTNSTIELILRHFCAGPIASTSFRRIGFTLGEASAAAQEKKFRVVDPGRRERFARVIFSGSLMPRSRRQRMEDGSSTERKTAPNARGEVRRGRH
jgi:hypothetical protein